MKLNWRGFLNIGTSSPGPRLPLCAVVLMNRAELSRKIDSIRSALVSMYLTGAEPRTNLRYSSHPALGLLKFARLVVGGSGFLSYLN